MLTISFVFQVVLNTVMSVVRCIASMLMSAAAIEGSYIDIVLWVTVRFFLLSTEMSVVVFGLAFGLYNLIFLCFYVKVGLGLDEFLNAP